MPSLYVITGPAGAGKSTVSKKIAEASARSALIEGDDLYGQIVGGYVDPWKEGNYLDTFWRLSLSSIRVYLEDGFDVVFNYIISPQQLDMIKAEFKDTKIRFAVLMMDEKTVLERDSRRPEEYQMKERCIVLLNEFKEHHYKGDHILDTSDLTVEETVSRIMEDPRFVVEDINTACCGIPSGYLV
ncbi:MAG: AAA family ATPase [Clostridiales bacterium]|nr:AAA family ATPase [Clostridiales bacterium]